ncbi:GLPGLI family protein [Flavobacterium sp. LS1P3]|jgi:GLPGLI family protein|uniref:GLPGLI family protein n=1 Tax=Flavobacterium sp. LS1P3 TaxID=3401720 RepID=UPI003AAFA84B
MKITYLLFLLSIIGYSQTVTVDYAEKNILTKERLEATPEFARKMKLASYNYILQYQDGVSLYKNSPETKNIEKIEEGGFEEPGAQYNLTNYLIEKWYYKDFNKNELLFNFYNGKYFYGKDSLLKWDWKITNETKKILGFKCKKATSNAFGYFFIAWFTEEIAINAGPEKFDGLPGLILYVGSAYYETFATAVKIEKTPIEIVKPEISKETVTMAQVESYIKGKIREFNSGPRTTTEIRGNTTIVRTKISSKQ